MAENDFDPQDVLASTSVMMLVRAGTFLGGCFFGHALGLLGTQFNSVASLVRFFTNVPAFGDMWSGVTGSLLISLFGATVYWFLWPWIVFFLYILSQFFFDENGWKIWFPWLVGGQSITSYYVITQVTSDGLGGGIVVVVLGAAAIIVGWKLLEAKLFEREMQRHDAIEAENRKKRAKKSGS